jgi:hypothetical protein
MISKPVAKNIMEQGGDKIDSSRDVMLRLLDLKRMK